MNGPFKECFVDISETYFSVQYRLNIFSALYKCVNYCIKQNALILSPPTLSNNLLLLNFKHSEYPETQKRPLSFLIFITIKDENIFGELTTCSQSSYDLWSYPPLSELS